MFANLISGIESMKLRLDDDLDGAGGVDDAAVTANVEVELQVAKDAEDQAEIVEDAAEIDDTVAEDDQLMRNYAELERAYDAIKEFGYTRQAAMLVDPLGQLPTLNPTIPALENMEVVASPNDAVTVAALETIGGAIKGVWDRIVKMCQWLREKVSELLTRAGAMLTNYNKKIVVLQKQVNTVKIDKEVLAKKNASVVSASDWNSAASKLIAANDKLASEIAMLGASNIESGKGDNVANIETPALPTPSEGFHWDPTNFTGNTQPASLANIIGKKLPKMIADTKKATTMVEAYARKKMETQGAAAHEKEANDARVKEIMTSIKKASSTANAHTLLAIRLLNMWVKAANIYLSAAEKPAKKEGK